LIRQLIEEIPERRGDGAVLELSASGDGGETADNATDRRAAEPVTEVGIRMLE
jgi:hypothetical protein